MTQLIEQLRQEVTRRGVAPVARELGMNRNTLTTVLLGTARQGSVALLEQAQARRAKKSKAA